MITILEAPKHTTNPEDWYVYADNCEERQLIGHKVFATCIAKALERTKGKLYLVMGTDSGELTFFSELCHKDANPKTILETFLSDYNIYRWKETTEGVREKSDNFQPITPLDFPYAFKYHQHLIDSYWKALAKIGRKLL